MIVRPLLTAILLVALAARAAAADEPPPPPPQPKLYFGALDALSHEDFSASAAAASDTLLALGLAAPIILELGRADADTDRRLLAYGGGVAASGLVAAAMKALWRRPRPYNFHPSEQVRAFARHAGKDARVSFPSGHAALTFAAAAAGGWIYASGSDSTSHRAAVWASGGAVAGATAVLRMRAGRHYPSDVLMGAAIGVAGVAVPAYAMGDVDLRGGEIAAMAGGVLLGAGLAAVLPFKGDVVLPIVVPGGAGVSVTY
jgi:membrane-associated phospholipid phosphatase